MQFIGVKIAKAVVTGVETTGLSIVGTLPDKTSGIEPTTDTALK